MAILFDGDDYLNKDLGGTGPISSYPVTLSAWIKPNSLGSSEMNYDFQDFVISDGSNTARIGLGAARYGRWGLYTKSNKAPTGSSFSENWSRTSANSWANVVGVFTAANARTGYVNGSGNTWSGGSNQVQTLSDADIIGVGSGSSTGSSNALSKNTVAECALWNVALTATEIDCLAAGFSPLLIRPESLLGYWPLGGAYPDYSDQVGGNALSATGDPASSSHPPIIHPSIPVVVKESTAEPVTADGSVSEYARTPDTSGSFTKPYDTSSTYSRETDTSGTFTRPSE